MNKTPYVKLKDKKNQAIQQKIKQKIIEPMMKAQSTYISWIFNFMRHDIGNCIQNMDSILNANSLEELTSEHLDSLKENVKILRSTIENFSNLAPSVISETEHVEKPLILVKSINQSHKIQLRIYDNGTEIPDTQKIFNYGYSTTGGSGLGLTHVKLICDMLKGSVYVRKSDIEEYTKYFCVEIPV